MKCIICNSEKSNERKCPICGFTSLNIQPGTPQEIIDKYNEEVARAKEKWHNANVNRKEDVRTIIQPIKKSNSYNLGWGTEHPGHLTILIDLSMSMSMEDGYNKNIEDVLYSVTTLLSELKSSGIDDDEIMERFSVTVIGYNTNVYTLFEGGVKNLIDKFNSIPDGALFFDSKSEAKPKGLTYTSKAITAAIEDVTNWIARQRNDRIPVPAPIVIHITDGKPEEDGRTFEESCNDAIAKAKLLKSIMADDGSTLFFNIHFNNATSNRTPVSFPSEPPKDRFVNFLYEISSTLEPQFVSIAQEKFNFPAKLGSKGMISNCKDRTILLRFITWSSLTTSTAETSLL